MDRRKFMLGSLAAVAACSAPERSLIGDGDVDAVRLGPASTHPPTGDESGLDTSSIEEGFTGEVDEIAEELEVPDPDLVELSFVASAVVDTVSVHDRPGGDVVNTLDNPIPSGGPLVFLVDELADSWYKVLLPLRPNGSTGWVRADEVTLARHNFRLLVELEEFRLTVFEHGEPVVVHPTGVAADNTPTPGGRYYLTELLQPPSPHSVYGSFAYGLSGFSEVLEEFAGGPGQLGIHGTNDPDSIGTKVSSGCIRLRNEDIEQLVVLGLPLGTPVVVV